MKRFIVGARVGDWPVFRRTIVPAGVLAKTSLSCVVHPMGIAELKAEALNLNQEERAELIGLMLDSLDGADPNDSGEDSLTEAIGRGEELKSGEISGLSEDGLLDEFRASRRR